MRGACEASLLSAPPMCRRLQFLDIKTSSSSSSLPPRAPRAFSKQTWDQLNEANYSSESSTGLSPADPISQAKFICHPTKIKRPLAVSIWPPMDPGRGRRQLFKNPHWSTCGSASIILTKKALLVIIPLEGKREIWRVTAGASTSEGAGILVSRPG